MSPMAAGNGSGRAQPTICGFSFGRDLTKLSYPVEAAVRSVLPICDRFVFAVGESEDDTRDRVASIEPVRNRRGAEVGVEIIDTRWPEVAEGGKVLAIEANKALDAAEATGCTWGFYIQADEAVHEQDLPAIEAAARQWVADAQVKALMFRYLHFILDYRTVDPWMYHKASRVVRLDGSCRIVGDACGPSLREYDGPSRNGGYLDKHLLGRHVQWARGDGRKAARIFHYGWVKTRRELEEKMGMVRRLWWGSLAEQEAEGRRDQKLQRLIDRYPVLRKFRGSHPAVMADRIERQERFGPVVNRWMNPRFYREVLAHGFHG